LGSSYTKYTSFTSLSLISIRLLPIEGCVLHWHEYDSFLFSILIPIFVFVIGLSVAILFYYVKKQKNLITEELKQNIVTYLILTNLVVFFQMYPRIIQGCLYILNCTQVGNNYYMIEDLSIQCYTQIHIFYFVVAIIIFIFYGIIIPLGVVLTIKKNMALHSPTLEYRYGFFYKEYRKYYWEIVPTFQKLFIAIILIFFANKPSVRATLIIFLYCVIIILQVFVNPFNYIKLHICSLLVNIAMLFTAICAQLALTQSYNINENINYSVLNDSMVLINSILLIIVASLFAYDG